MDISTCPNVPAHVQEQATYETARNGYQLIHIGYKTNYQDDNHLFNVVASNEARSGQPDRFVKWSFNSSTGSLNHGHYNLTQASAMELVQNHTSQSQALQQDNLLVSMTIDNS